MTQGGMPLLDLISAVYVGFGAFRGYKRGLADEAYRLLRMLFAFLAGVGLYGLVAGAIERALSLGGGVSGPIGFVATMGGAWYALRQLKKSVTGFLAGRFAAWTGMGGAIAGALRTLLIVVSAVGVFHLSGLNAGGKVDEDISWIAKIAGRVVNK